MNVIAGLAVVAAITTSGCGVQPHAEPAAGLAAFAPGLATNGSPVSPAPTAADLSVPLQVVQGRFLGIGLGSSLGEALRVLGLTPVVEHADQPMQQSNTTTPLRPCIASGDRWMIHADGLTLEFEGGSAATAKLTSWVYTGGPVVGFTQMVASEHITIGGTRRSVLAAYPGAHDRGNVIEVVAPASLQFGLQGGAVSWFGATACAMLEN
jgi:hypothetical protein